MSESCDGDSTSLSWPMAVEADAAAKRARAMETTLTMGESWPVESENATKRDSTTQ